VPSLSQLRYVVAVDGLRHFGRAAKKCNVSQPALSIQIQKMEEELGIVLFDRKKKPLQTTDSGKRIIEQAKLILRESEKLKELAKTDSEEPHGDFQLAIIPTLAPYLLPLFVEDFSERYPKVRLRIDELNTETVIQRLKEDSLDAAILATPLQEKAIKEKVLFYEEFFLFVGERSRLKRSKIVKESDLEASGAWLLQDSHCLRQQMSRVCSGSSASGVFKNIQFEGGNLETLRLLIKRGQGYTLMPQLFVLNLSPAEQRQYVKTFEAPAPSREVSLVYRREQWKTEILKALESCVLSKLPKTVKRSHDRKQLERIPL
jgi:LysR family hydrogen peroxide-inducible transcriptional activator